VGLKATSGWRRILVPVADNLESQRALDVACRLAAESRAAIVLVAVIEIPALLPFDAHMVEEEHEARTLLSRACTIADSYGISASTRILRAREASTAIVEAATSCHTELLVIGAPHRRRASTNAAVFGTTVQHVLKRAPCRVMIIAAPQGPETNGRPALHSGEPVAARA
jgi:nucleotide-binding universal stress UspA family protein